MAGLHLDYSKKKSAVVRRCLLCNFTYSSQSSVIRPFEGNPKETSGCSCSPCRILKYEILFHVLIVECNVFVLLAVYNYLLAGIVSRRKCNIGFLFVPRSFAYLQSNKLPTAKSLSFFSVEARKVF